jgi:putative MATE family efflux protein
MADATLRPPGRRDLTEGALGWNLFTLAVPLMVQMSIQAVYNLTDAFWLGKLSPLAVTAPGVSMPFAFIVAALAMGFGNGGAALVAQYAGAGRHDDADRAAGQTLLFVLSVSVVMMGLILLLMRPLLALVQAPDDVAGVARLYLSTFILGTPFVACTMAYGFALRSLGDTLTVVYISGAAGLLNLVLDPVLIFWMDMGVTGAALASVIAQFAGAVACVILLYRGRSGLKVTLHDLKPNVPMLRQILQIGLPAGISMSSNSVGFTAFQALVNSLGKSVIAAFTIGFRTTHFLSIPGHCMAMAAAPIVGQALGAGKPKLAHRAVRLSVVIVALGMAIPYALMMWQGRLVTRFFIDDPEVIQEAFRFFLIVPASNYFFTVIMVLGAAFYGSGHTRPILVVSLLRQWALRVPLAYLLGHTLGWGSLGIYVGMGLANILCAVLMIWLFRAGGWAKAVIPTASDPESARTPIK